MVSSLSVFLSFNISLKAINAIRDNYRFIHRCFLPIFLCFERLFNEIVLTYRRSKSRVCAASVREEQGQNFWPDPLVEEYFVEFFWEDMNCGEITGRR